MGERPSAYSTACCSKGSGTLISTLRFLGRLTPVVLFLTALLASACAPAARPTAPPPGPIEPAIRISGSGTVLPFVAKLAAAYQRQRPAARFEIDSGTNSGGAIAGVIRGALDLGVVNRTLSDAEAKGGLEYRAFAHDAVSFAVHLPNAVRGLTRPQVQAIYGGSVTSWDQIGGLALPIIVLDRDEDESMRKLVLLKLLDGQPVQARSVVLSKAREMVDALEGTSEAVGYSSLGLLRLQPSKDVRVLALDGILPSREAVLSGAYPWYVAHGLVWRPDAPAGIRSFLDFIRSQAGREALEAYDLVALGG